MCVLIRCSYGCPHTPIASACSYFCPYATMCPDTTDVAALKDFGPAGRTHCYVSSYYLLYMRPHPTKCVHINSSRAGPSTHTRTHTHTHAHTNTHTQEDGFVAKILRESGSNDVPVGEIVLVICSRMLTYADVCCRTLMTYADVR